MKIYDKASIIKVNLYYMDVENYYTDAKYKYFEAIQYKSDDHLSHFNLAIVLTSLGDYKNARIHLNKVIEINPDYEVTYIQLKELTIITELV